MITVFYTPIKMKVVFCRIFGMGDYEKKNIQYF